MAKIFFFLVTLVISCLDWSFAQIGGFDYDYLDYETGENYRGKYIGDLSTHHHQVSGSVYAVDKYTLLLKDFTYNGGGKDTFFMVGTTNQPSRKGDIGKLGHFAFSVLTCFFINVNFFCQTKWLFIFSVLTCFFNVNFFRQTNWLFIFSVLASFSLRLNFSSSFPVKSIICLFSVF